MEERLKDGERRKANRPTYPIEEIQCLYIFSGFVYSLLSITN